MPTTTTHTAPDRTDTRSLWTRFLDKVLPAPDADRLVRVAEVSRGVLPLAEGSLADVAITPVIQEVASATGSNRFVVLVSAREAETATAALRGL